MRWSYNLERSYAAALWLSGVASLVVLMVIVGGATRLTGSGLSITEWKPVTGVLPPLSSRGWLIEFAKYQHIPQYALVTKGLTLGAFKSLYWWEWTHRLLGRIVGAAILIPMVILIAGRHIPQRLIWRCGVILALVALEGLVGWWMVASGLETRISVAPERLATHLSLALLIFCVCIWTALEAWFGRARAAFGAETRWIAGSVGLVVLCFFQIMLGALVAGNRAGQVFTDWPLMGGRLFPAAYAPSGSGFWEVVAHSVAAVQFNHRMVAYVLLICAIGFAASLLRTPRTLEPVRRLALTLAGLVSAQALLGVLTLRLAAPLPLSMLHQLGAVAVLATALILTWRIQRN